MGLAVGQCRRTIAGLTARDKPVPTPIGLRGLRDQCPSAKLSDSLDPCRGLSTAPVSIHAPPWSSIPGNANSISYFSRRPDFEISKGTHAPPVRSPSPPTPTAHFTRRPLQASPLVTTGLTTFVIPQQPPSPPRPPCNPARQAPFDLVPPPPSPSSARHRPRSSRQRHIAIFLHAQSAQHKMFSGRRGE